MQIKVSILEAIRELRALYASRLELPWGDLDLVIEYPKEPVIERTFVPISASNIYALAGQNGERKIAAIKLLREATPGLGLGDAKRIVEAIMRDGKDSHYICNDESARVQWIDMWDRLYKS